MVQEPHRGLVWCLRRLPSLTFLSKMLNQDPFSVQLLRRVNTRIPTPVFSSFIASTAPPPSPADLRMVRGSPATSSPSSWRANAGLTAETANARKRPHRIIAVGPLLLQSQHDRWRLRDRWCRWLERARVLNCKLGAWATYIEGEKKIIHIVSNNFGENKPRSNNAG